MTVVAKTSRTAMEVVNDFNEAWNRANLDELMQMISEDCVFENTSPTPDGERFIGKDAIRTAWEPVLNTPGMRFEAEEILESGDRIVVRWVYHWRNSDGTPGHVRGVDVMKVRDGLVSEKLSYVKG